MGKKSLLHKDILGKDTKFLTVVIYIHTYVYMYFHLWNMCIYIWITGRKYNRRLPKALSAEVVNHFYSSVIFIFVCFRSIFRFTKNTFLKASIGILKNLNFCVWLTKHFYVWLFGGWFSLLQECSSPVGGRQPALLPFALPSFYSALAGSMSYTLATWTPHPGPLEAIHIPQPLPQPRPAEWVSQNTYESSGTRTINTLPGMYKVIIRKCN